MNLAAISESLGEVLYDKGVIGHVTVDLISFPNPDNVDDHHLFWALDLNFGLTDYASICLFFDILMEGKIEKTSGEYRIELIKDPEDQ